MSKSRRDGLYLVLVGSLVFIFMGAALEQTVPAPLADFKTIYFASHTLAGQHDPFQVNDVMPVYQAERDSRTPDTAKNRQIATQNIYPPNTLFLVMPLAVLPLKLAGLLWLTLTFASFILASLLVWDLGAEYAPVLSGVLIGFLLANSELLAVTGNVAGLAISFCAIAVWCFARRRYGLAGVVCLALSLVLKPHDTGLVWLYFVLAGAEQRKRALQSLLAALAVSLPGLVWIWRVAPHWIEEWSANLAAYSAHGGVNDPGLSSSGGHGLDKLISLQTVFSVFRDEPRFYNRASLLLCGPLFLLLIYLLMRRRNLPEVGWMALSAIAALSLLPIYHRQLDAALLLLAVPGCVLLWGRNRNAGRWGIAIMGAALALTGAFSSAVISGLLNDLPFATAQGVNWSMAALQVFPAPLIVLAMAIFFLWAYAKRMDEPVEPVERARVAADSLR
jgi:hypothetical protein